MSEPASVRAALCRLSLSSVGFYPQAVTDSDGTRHDRTPWQEGWNAARSAITARLVTLHRWYQTLSADQQARLMTLLESAALDVDFAEGEVLLSWNCNDLFARSTVDAEVLPEAAWRLVADLWRSYGEAGVLAWIARQRQATPLPACITPRYAAASAWLARPAVR